MDGSYIKITRHSLVLVPPHVLNHYYFYYHYYHYKHYHHHHYYLYNHHYYFHTPTTSQQHVEMCFSGQISRLWQRPDSTWLRSTMARVGQIALVSVFISRHFRFLIVTCSPVPNKRTFFVNIANSVRELYLQTLSFFIQKQLSDNCPEDFSWRLISKPAGLWSVQILSE